MRPLNRRAVRAVQDAWASHPVIDVVVAVTASSVVLAWWRPAASTSARETFLEGVGTLSGLVLAAATFVCVMTYSSTADLMVGFRRSYGSDLKKNWKSIIGSTLLGGAVSLCLIPVEATWTVYVGFAIAILLVLRGLRSVWWMTFTMFMEDSSEKLMEVDGPRNLKRAS